MAIIATATRIGGKDMALYSCNLCGDLLGDDDECDYIGRGLYCARCQSQYVESMIGAEGDAYDQYMREMYDREVLKELESTGSGEASEVNAKK
jgi:hypothetical protein